RILLCAGSNVPIDDNAHVVGIKLASSQLVRLEIGLGNFPNPVAQDGAVLLKESTLADFPLKLVGFDAMLLQRRHGFIEYDEGRIQIGSLRRVVFSLSGQSGICLDETFEISIVIARITGCVLDDPLQVRQCTGIILVLE